MQKLSHFENEWVRQDTYGFVADYRLSVATDIIRHCALISAEINGEDSSGRQAVRLLTAKEVAVRAVEIADELVSLADEKGWMRKPEVTTEERTQYHGLLEKLRLYGGYSDDNTKLYDAMKKIEMLTNKETA